MKGILILGLVLSLVFLPMVLARRPPRTLLIAFLAATTGYWLFILFIAPRLPE